jgi:hypothetical protein
MSHLALLSECKIHLEALLEREIQDRQEHHLPPAHLRGLGKCAERSAFYRTTTNPQVLALIQKIETVENEAAAAA